MRRQADADGQARLTEAQREQADGLTGKRCGSHKSTREMFFFCVCVCAFVVVFVQTRANADGCGESNKVFIIDRLLITSGEGSRQLETACRRPSSSLIVPGQGSILLIGVFILTISKSTEAAILCLCLLTLWALILCLIPLLRFKGPAICKIHFTNGFFFYVF